MFKVFSRACAILPYPRGEIMNTQCYIVKDQWQPSLHGYPSKVQCLERVNTITTSIRNNFNLLDLKKNDCKKTRELS